MPCQYCKGKCQKAGRQRNGAQKLFCSGCRKYQQEAYRYRACQRHVGALVGQLVGESVGIRGIARILEIGTSTVMRHIIKRANEITKPDVLTDQPSFELDELWTYIGRKENEHWVAYALDRKKNVVDFVVGKRTTATLRQLIDRLLSSGVKKIRTDRLMHYRRLIPNERHHCSTYGINHIERKNLTLRTHLKRLSRRTICFSRKFSMLESCLKIYFWGKVEVKDTFFRSSETHG
jgi:insertion element IS1 protein InsB